MAAELGVLLLPKNRGLAAQVDRALEGCASGDERVYVRGEDVPYLASELARQGRRVRAFTGDDLVDEWLANGNALDRRIVRRRVRWHDSAALYGAPALCLIGPATPSPTACAPGDAGIVRVAVCGRYRGLAARFLAGCAGDGTTYDLIFAQGSLETLIVQKVADLVIDVVVTGATIAAAGLRVQRVISTSDLAVLESQP